MSKILRALVEDYYDIQHSRIEIQNQLRSYKQDVSQQEEIFIKETIEKRLMSIEKDIVKYIDKVLRDEPLYKWLSGIKGIGPILAAGLLAWLVDISKFKTISKLWAYCGVAGGYVKSECAKGHKMISTTVPASCPVFASKKNKKDDSKKCDAKVKLVEDHQGEVPRRQVGWLILQNKRLKTHMWKIGESFVKTNGGYRKLYDQFRSEYEQKWITPEDCKSIGCKNKKKCLDGHKYAAAKRKVVKVFLAHFHMKWSEIKGLPIQHPFIIGRNGHEHLIEIINE